MALDCWQVQVFLEGARATLHQKFWFRAISRYLGREPNHQFLEGHITPGVVVCILRTKQSSLLAYAAFPCTRESHITPELVFCERLVIICMERIITSEINYVVLTA